ncbi:MAG: 2-oxoacid:acceptor oxidoreductase family protein [Deltaproteobacteria bacterium]|jgi:2-oxoglutarate ferredoxin oxidoreductase subunit gamma|nr:2-oxoacid:acceptor oxidoreductase family protein [Deltaproteobacteria bacterium]
MNSFRREILISGFGGQGVVLAGRSLGLAAVHGGLEATMLISHGTETRGGYVRSQLVISDGEIDSPVVERADVFLALSQAAYERFRGMALNGLTLYDSDLVEPTEGLTHQLALPARRIAIESLGTEQAANMVALGHIAKLLDFLPFDCLRQAVTELSKRGREVNLAALELGRSLELE